MLKYSTLIAVLIFSTFKCYSQVELTYLDILDERKNQVRKHHYNSDVAKVITGKKYPLRYLSAVNSQFFRTEEPEYASLTYDGIKLDSVELQYDLFSQKIVVLLESKNTAEYVSIDTDKVSEFLLNDCLFVQVKQDSVMKEGMYQLAYDGQESSLFIKRKKRRLEKIDAGKMTIIFQSFDEYYVTNAYGSFKVSGKKDLLSAFQNSEQLKSLIKKRKIKFSKKVKENGIIAAVSLFDSELTSN